MEDDQADPRPVTVLHKVRLTPGYFITLGKQGIKYSRWGMHENKSTSHVEYCNLMHIKFVCKMKWKRASKQGWKKILTKIWLYNIYNPQYYLFKGSIMTNDFNMQVRPECPKCTCQGLICLSASKSKMYCVSYARAGVPKPFYWGSHCQTFVHRHHTEKWKDTLLHNDCFLVVGL